MTDAVTGTVPIDLAITAAGDTQTATLTADLTNAGLGVPVFGWSKAAGAAGRLSVNATLVNGGIGAVTALSAQAPGLDIDGVAKAGTLDFTHADIGETVAQGRLTPAGGGQPWRLDFSGPALSLRAILKPAGKAQAKAEAAATPGAAAPSGPAWAATFRFTSFRLAKAPAPRLRNFSFTGSGEGGTLLTANVHAATGPGLPVTLVIAPGPGRRRNVHLATPDGGELLRVIGAYDDLQGGALVLDAQYGDLQPVNGTLSVDQFRVLQAPAIGKILQGLTIYGVAEATSGPGLEFDRLVAPFSIAAGRLTLRNARAFSTSLGFTASGDIALADGSCDIATTIIPAYAINALPGKIPVIGKLFSAEKGGGLFAVRARITGRLADPDVSVNPLSALTPGVLRDVFGGGGN